MVSRDATRVLPLEETHLKAQNEKMLSVKPGQSLCIRTTTLLWRLAGAPCIHGILVYMALQMTLSKGGGSVATFLWPANAVAIVHLIGTKNLRTGFIELMLLIVAYIVVVTHVPPHRSYAHIAGTCLAQMLEIGCAVYGLRKYPLSISIANGGHLTVTDLKRICLWGGLLGPLTGSVAMCWTLILFHPSASVTQDIVDGIVIWCVKHAAFNIQLIWSLTLIKHHVQHMSVNSATPQSWNITSFYRFIELSTCMAGITVAIFFASAADFTELYLISLLLMAWVSYHFDQFVHAVVQLYTFCCIIAAAYVYTALFDARENAALNILLYTCAVTGCFVAGAQYESKLSFREIQEQYRELQESKEEIETKNKQSLLFAFMSHEFKTPLTIILGFVDECRFFSVPPEVDTYMTHISTMARDLLVQITDILDMLRLGAGKDKLRVESVNLHSVFSSSVTKLRVIGRASNVSVTSFISPEVPRLVLADRVRLEEILNNISGNAVKYSADNRRNSNECTKSHSSTCTRSLSGGSNMSDLDALGACDIENQSGSAHACQMQPQCKMELLVLDCAMKLELQNEGTMVLEPTFWRGTCTGVSASAIVLRVSDSGRGIPKALHKSIFSSYERVGSSTEQISLPGTGLGLAICKQLVTKMGGGIHLRSGVGEGSTFSIILQFEVPSLENISGDSWLMSESPYSPLNSITAPLLESVEEKRSPLHESENEKGLLIRRDTGELPGPLVEDGDTCRSLHVLVVEDTPLNQKLISAILRRQGHSYKIASNGKIALDLLLETDKAQGAAPFDAILLDLFMPVCSGEEFLRARGSYLPSHLALLPVCVVSADVGPGVKERLEILPGVVGVLEKPYRPASIMTLLAAAVNDYQKRFTVPSRGNSKVFVT